MKQTIIDLLRSTNREGIEGLIWEMENGGFFEAPASGAYHLCVPGGLAEHTLNVYKAALQISTALQADVPMESLVIATILHDLGKMGDKGKRNYVENYVRSKAKNKETGEYDMVQSASKPYETNKDLVYIEHEIRSVMIAERFIELTEQEEQAIICHNGLYGKMMSSFSHAADSDPLYLILHTADMWASRIVENEKVNRNE